MTRLDLIYVPIDHARRFVHLVNNSIGPARFVYLIGWKTTEGTGRPVYIEMRSKYKMKAKEAQRKAALLMSRDEPPSYKSYATFPGYVETSKTEKTP